MIDLSNRKRLTPKSTIRIEPEVIRLFSRGETIVIAMSNESGYVDATKPGYIRINNYRDPDKRTVFFRKSRANLYLENNGYSRVHHCTEEELEWFNQCRKHFKLMPFNFLKERLYEIY